MRSRTHYSRSTGALPIISSTDSAVPSRYPLSERSIGCRALYLTTLLVLISCDSKTKCSRCFYTVYWNEFSDRTRALIYSEEEDNWPIGRPYSAQFVVCTFERRREKTDQ